MRTPAALALAACMLFAPPAFARDKIADLLDDAKVALREERHEQAGTAIGKAAAAAHQQGDLVAEWDVGQTLAACVESRDLLTAEGGAAKVRAVLLAVLAELPPGRAGAYVSGPVIGRTLLYDATATGEFDAVAAASRALSAHAKGAKSGRAAPVLAAYGKGMAARAMDGTDEAIDELSLALSDAVAARWTELALHVGTELAAVRLAAGDEDGARDALGQAGTTLTYGGKDGGLARIWARLVKTRLPDANENVLSRYAKAIEPYAEGLNRGSAGGSGGRGGNAASSKASPLGAAFPKLGKTKPLVRVKRTAKGFDISPLIRGVESSEHDYDPSVVHWDDGGLGLFFYRDAVALGALDFIGTQGQPGGSSHPRASQAFYLLADGETWTVTKAGVVQIGK